MSTRKHEPAASAGTGQADKAIASSDWAVGARCHHRQAGDRAVSGRPTAIGTQRRLQALMARGWSLQSLARAEGLRAPQLARALENSAVITPKLAADVSTAYDRLWNADPPRRTEVERQLADAAGEAARIRGWVPPLAWDDDQIESWLPSRSEAGNAVPEPACARPTWPRTRSSFVPRAATRRPVSVSSLGDSA